MWGKRKMPVARCKYCNNWLFNEDVGREYIQINSDMKIQSKFICLKCEIGVKKRRFLWAIQKHDEVKEEKQWKYIHIVQTKM